MGESSRVIWFYQLCWWCKLATVKSFQPDISSISRSSSESQYIINLVYKTKLYIVSTVDILYMFLFRWYCMSLYQALLVRGDERINKRMELSICRVKRQQIFFLFVFYTSKTSAVLRPRAVSHVSNADRWPANGWYSEDLFCSCQNSGTINFIDGFYRKTLKKKIVSLRSVRRKWFVISQHKMFHAFTEIG